MEQVNLITDDGVYCNTRNCMHILCEVGCHGSVTSNCLFSKTSEGLPRCPLYCDKILERRLPNKKTSFFFTVFIFYHSVAYKTRSSELIPRKDKVGKLQRSPTNWEKFISMNSDENTSASCRPGAINNVIENCSPYFVYLSLTEIKNIDKTVCRTTCHTVVIGWVESREKKHWVTRLWYSTE